MSNNNVKKVQFVVGQPVFVWKETGAREGKAGPTTSERLGQDYPDIKTDEPLMVMVKYGTTKALCRRESRKGEKDYEITVHINHVNPQSSYYANRAEKLATASKLTPEQEIARATAEAEAAAKRLEELKAKASAMTPAAASGDANAQAEAPTQTIAGEDIDEAASLFASAES